MEDSENGARFSARAAPLEVPLAVADSVRRLPKADLHVHLAGAVRPSTLASFRRSAASSCDFRNPIAVPVDFDVFRARHRECVEALATTERIVRVIEEIAADAFVNGVVRVEVILTLSPLLDLHCIPVDELMGALGLARVRAAMNTGVSIGFIIDEIASASAAQWGRAVAVAQDAVECGVVGLGLSGVVPGISATELGRLISPAQDAGLAFLPHAGEVGDASVLRELLDLAPTRIGHGLAAAWDRRLLRLLAERRIHVEVALSSNYLTGRVADLRDHPLRRMLREGVPVSLATDDPGLFGTSLVGEYSLAFRIGCSAEDLQSIAEMSIDGSLGATDMPFSAPRLLSSVALQSEAEESAGSVA